jgi:S1-C subfamily serine protease
MWPAAAFAVVGGLLLAMAVAAPVTADQAKVPESSEEIALSFAPVVRRVAPAVVNIYAERMVRQQAFSPLFDDPFSAPGSSSMPAVWWSPIIT